MEGIMKMQTTSIIPLVLLTMYACGCSSEPKSQKTEEVKVADLGLRSDAFAQGEMIPKKYTCDGDDISPSLTWSKAPDSTKELVLICDDPDAPHRTWDHWIVYGISPGSTGLAEGAASSIETDSLGIHGKNSWRQNDYGGPCPPSGPAHRYYFKLYALDTKLDLPSGTSKADLEKGMEGHILAKGELLGKYGR